MILMPMLFLRKCGSVLELHRWPRQCRQRQKHRLARP